MKHMESILCYIIPLTLLASGSDTHTHRYWFLHKSNFKKPGMLELPDLTIFVTGKNIFTITIL